MLYFDLVFYRKTAYKAKYGFHIFIPFTTNLKAIEVVCVFG